MMKMMVFCSMFRILLKIPYIKVVYVLFVFYPVRSFVLFIVVNKLALIKEGGRGGTDREKQKPVSC